MVCLITGASRGLGKAVALAFGKRGHQVVVHSRVSRDEAHQVASLMNGSFVVSADVRNTQEVTALVGEVVEKWGRIDVLVNNAGITRESLLLKTSEDDFDDVISVNLKGPFNVMRAVVHHMTEQKFGHIINISSMAGHKGKTGLSAYAASKAGLIGLTLSAARELGQYNIMVNAILPGFMLTDMGNRSSYGARNKALGDSLIKEFSAPENVAEFICYLAGTTGITGQVFNLDSRII